MKTQIHRALALCAAAVLLPACHDGDDDDEVALSPILPVSLAILAAGSSSTGVDVSLPGVSAGDAAIVFNGVPVNAGTNVEVSGTSILSGGGTFVNPTSIWSDSESGILVITDAGPPARVHIFTNVTRPVSITGAGTLNFLPQPAPGTALVGFAGAVFDAVQDRALVVDTMGTVHFFNNVSQMMPQGLVRTASGSFSAGDLVGVTSVAFDPGSGLLFVASAGALGGSDSAITIFDTGSVDFSLGSQALSAGSFRQIRDLDGNGLGGVAPAQDFTGLALDPTGRRLFVLNGGLQGGILVFTNIDAVNGDVAPATLFTDVGGVSVFNGIAFMSSGDRLFLTAPGNDGIFRVDGTLLQPSGSTPGTRITHNSVFTTGSTVRGLALIE